MTEPIALKYRAFISYSHVDTGWAKWLHRALEGFPIDKDLVGRGMATSRIPKTLRPIFRDRDDFTAGHTLNEQTLAALDASHSLIVICSPASAKSHYVNEELRLFKSRHPERPVIPFIVDGQPDDLMLECFPPALKLKITPEGKISELAEQPLGADVREEGDGKNLALAKVVAGLLDVSSDEVFRRAERERRRRGRVRNSIIAVLAILTVAASGSAVYAWQQLKTNEAFLNATLKTATEIVDEAVGQAENYGVPRRATVALLTKAEGLFDNMALLGRPTPDLRYQKAWMLIQFARNYAILGDTVKQKARAEEAQLLLAGLTAEAPGDRTYDWSLSAAHDELGDVFRVQGNLAAALKSFRDSIAIADRLAKANPSDDYMQDQLAGSYLSVGDVLLEQGNPAAARQSYQDSLSIRERLVRETGQYGGLGLELTMEDGVLKVVAPFKDKPASKAGIQSGDIITAIDKQDLEGLTLKEATEKMRGPVRVPVTLTILRKGIKENLDVTIVREANHGPNNASWQRGLSISYEKMGDVLVEQGNLAEALKYFRDSLSIKDGLVKADPNNARWQAGLSVSYERVGSVLLAQDNLPEALEAYRASLAIRERLAKADPSNTVSQQSLTRSYRKVGDVLVRQDNLTEALKFYQDSQTIHDRLVQLDPSNAGWQYDRAVSIERIGNVMMAQGHLAEALKSFRDSLAITDHLAKADPTNSDLKRDITVFYYHIGQLLLEQGNLADALQALQEAVAIGRRLAETDKSNAKTLINLADSLDLFGDVKLQQGDTAGAIAVYEESLIVAGHVAEIDKSNIRWHALHQRGVAFWLKGDLDKALADLDAVLKIAPDDIDALTTRAGVLKDKGNYDNAIADYDKVIAVKPDNAIALSNRGIAYWLKGDLDKALADLDESLRLAPYDADTRINHGAVLDNKGDHDGAIADYDKVLAEQPDNASALNARAWAYAQRGNLDRALSDADRAVALNPNEPNTLDTRGWIHIAMGESDLALADLDKALSIDPELASAYADRGRAYELKGERDKAIADYRKALSLKRKGTDDDRAKAEALRRLTAFGAVNTDTESAEAAGKTQP